MSNSREESFTEFFKKATAGFTPYKWQTLIATEGLPDVLPVPTGLGKTEVVLAWAWRLLVDRQGEPRHLVYCLPMRSLVTQTVQRLKGYFERLKQVCPFVDVKVYQLMGGAIDDEWAGQPDKPWVLVGTQDQLLSRALNRGYAMRRFDWPVHFGLLNNDCRWLIDEVQLMGPGLWTTAQLDWMRQKRFPPLKPCLTTWMSATVGTKFLKTKDRECAGMDKPSEKQVNFENELNVALTNDKSLNWWRAARRPLEWWQPSTSGQKTGGGKKQGAAKPATAATATPEAIATSVVAKHVARTLTLVICNTVELAQEVFRKLQVKHKVLLTSRFRGEDREKHEQDLIRFDADRKANTLPDDDPGLICVSTQVIEAGIDISAHRLFTELAPWPSMLQRLGRLNRKGDDRDPHAWVWETPQKGGKKVERIGPYEAGDIKRAKELVNIFVPLSKQKSFSEAINDLNQNNGEKVTEALQPKESPLPRALDVHQLFSTERDVHGGFTDISAFVRGTDPDLDVTVFWRDWSGEHPPSGDDLDGPLLEPAKEGCPVSFIRVQEFLSASKGKAWLWNDETDCWESVSSQDIRPGMLVMLKRDVGGYDATYGWTGNKSDALSEVPRAGRGATLRDDTRTEAGYWSRLTDHLKDARREAEALCGAICLQDDLRKAVVEAAALHDLGKAHPQWQSALPAGISSVLLAKTPYVVAADVAGDASTVQNKFTQLRPKAYALPDERRRRGCEEVLRLRWAIDDKLSENELQSLCRVSDVRWAGHVPFRPGLRHEAASALAMWRKYRNSEPKPYPALAVYLAAAHHGKVRTVMRSTTKKRDDVFGIRSEPDSLVIECEHWLLDFSVTKDGAEGRWEGGEGKEEFVMTGPGWTGLVTDLLGPWRPEEKSNAGAVPQGEPRELGPFALAYLEALVRIADWRASNPACATGAVKPSEVEMAAEIRLPVLALPGLSPDSLGNYLASLGLLRVLSRKWPSTRIAWRDDVLRVVGGPPTLDELLNELVQIANNSEWTGYTREWSNEQKKGTKEKSGTPLALWQAKAQESQLQLFAAHAVPHVLVSFNPLLGSGGNAGKRDFAKGWKKAVEALAPSQTSAKEKGKRKPGAGATGITSSDKRDALRAWLLGQPVTWMVEKLNAGSWFSEATELYNSGQKPSREAQQVPWAMVLACEGLVFFAGGASRRLGARSASTVGAFPFITQPIAASAKNEVKRLLGEVWIPLWSRPMSLAEVGMLFSRGRAELRGRGALTPAEFATAIPKRGIDAGVSEVRRFTLGHTTSSKTFEPRLEARFLLSADARWAGEAAERITALIEQRGFPRDGKRFVGLRGPIESALLDVASEPNRSEAGIALLDAVVRTLDRIDRNRSFREAKVRWEPLPLEWLPSLFADEQPSVEARLALSLVSAFPPALPFAAFRFGVEWTREQNGRYEYDWTTKPRQFEHSKVAPARWVWGPGDLARVLGAVLSRRLLEEAVRDASSTKIPQSRAPFPATTALIRQWLTGEIDELLFAAWLSRLALFDWRNIPEEVRKLISTDDSTPRADGELALLGLFQPLIDRCSLVITDLSPNNLLSEETGARTTEVARSLVTLIRAGNLDAAVRLAGSRYAMAGARLATFDTPFAVRDPDRLAAALLFPLSTHARTVLFTRWLRPRRQPQRGEAHA